MLPSEELGQVDILVNTQFLSKLWRIVNDTNTDDLIRWSPKGTSFYIIDQTRFSQELVPKYFKHNNMASFVRQLNMYGFRKVVSVEAGGLSIYNGEIEFSHPQFIRGQPSLIKQIKRKPQTTRAVATTDEIQTASSLLQEVQNLRHNQDNMSSKLMNIKKENELLWREYASIRQKFSKQQQIIEKLVQFLVAMVKSPNQSLTPKRKFNRLALEGAEGLSSTFSDEDSLLQHPANRLTGPVIHEVTNINGNDQPQFLEKVFQSDSSVPTVSCIANPSPTPTDTSSSTALIRTKTRDESRLKVEPIDAAPSPPLGQNGMKYSYGGQVQPILEMSDGSPASLFSDASDQNDQVIPGDQIIPNVDPFDFVNPDLVTELDGGTTDNTLVDNQGVVYVTSPNGTNIENQVTCYDPEQNPELLQLVDPSAVNPNIIVNSQKQNEVTWPTSSAASTSSNTTAARTRGAVVTKNAQGGLKSLIRNPGAIVNIGGKQGAGKVINVNPASVVRPSQGKSGKGKSISRGKSNFAAPIYPSDTQTAQNPISTTSDVAIPDKQPFIDKDITSHLEDVQSSLDSLHDIFNSGTLNVDTSTILSPLNEVLMMYGRPNRNRVPLIEAPFPPSQLFGNDDSLTDEQWPNNNSGVSGTEVSLYNPSLYDIAESEMDDNYSFSSLLNEDEPLNTSESSSSKRPRLIIKKEGRTNSIPDESLSTPRPYQS